MNPKAETIIKRKMAFVGRDAIRRTEQYMDRKTRLQRLVELHGIEMVALASDLAESTLTQYVRTKGAQPISEQTIQQAEFALEGL